jgi:MarR family transcriptional regulator, organic hydroperoxide resistance regulator
MSERSTPLAAPPLSPQTATHPIRRRPRRTKQHAVGTPAEAASILHHWREAVPDDRFAHLVKDAARSFQRSLQRRLMTCDVPFGHWTFLRVLWEHDGLTQKQLSDEVGVMEPSTFAAVKAMESRGWVERRQLAVSKKNVYVFLTDAGRALKAVLVPMAETVNGLGINGLSDEDMAVAKRVLLVIITQLAADVSADPNAVDAQV